MLVNPSSPWHTPSHSVLFLLQPLYGFTSSDYIPFRNVSGGGRDLHFTDDKEIDLDDLTSKPLPKVPLQSSLKGNMSRIYLKLGLVYKTDRINLITMNLVMAD